MDPDVRREVIVEAAVAVASRKGLSATTVRDIAVEMCTSSGLIHHYFASMDEVMVAVFSRVAAADLASTKTVLEAEDTPTKQLSALFASFVSDNDRVFQMWLDAWSEAGRNPTIRRITRELNIEWQQLLRDVISAGVASGEFEDGDADVVAWKALSLLDGLSLQVVAHRTVIDRSKAAEWAATSTENDLGLPVGTLRATSPV